MTSVEEVESSDRYAVEAVVPCLLYIRPQAICEANLSTLSLSEELDFSHPVYIQGLWLVLLLVISPVSSYIESNSYIIQRRCRGKTRAANYSENGRNSGNLCLHQGSCYRALNCVVNNCWKLFTKPAFTRRQKCPFLLLKQCTRAGFVYSTLCKVRKHGKLAS